MHLATTKLAGVSSGGGFLIEIYVHGTAILKFKRVSKGFFYSRKNKPSQRSLILNSEIYSD